MKFPVMVALTLLGTVLLLHTLEPPLMTASVRWPLTVLAAVMALVTLMLERWLRPKEGGTHGLQVRKVMGMTMIKMMLMLGLILAYLIAKLPDPMVFGVAAYLIYLANTAVLVAESMRHYTPPTAPR